MLSMNKQVLITIVMNNCFMSYSILVADDSSFMRTMLSKIFQNTPGVGEIREANNGAEALEMYKKKKADLVTMDYDMPELNGIDTAKQIKSFDPKAKIVMVTSSDKSELRDEASKIATMGYITKPFDRTKIKALIDKLS